MIFAIFKHYGYTPLLKHLFVKSARTGAIIGFANFKDLVSTSICLIRNVEAVIFQTLPLPHLALPLPLPPTKKTTVNNFFNFCGFVACLLLHFIILRKQKPSFIAITLPSSLELIVSNYSVFVFLRYQNSC